jgi:hypothetical protein
MTIKEEAVIVSPYAGALAAVAEQADLTKIEEVRAYPIGALLFWTRCMSRKQAQNFLKSICSYKAPFIPQKQ